MVEPQLRHRSAEWPETAEFNGAVHLEEAIVVAFRRHTLLPLDDRLYALQPTIPHLTRSSLHRSLKRHGISRPPQVGDESAPASDRSGA
jgi:hypothetical protein